MNFVLRMLNHVLGLINQLPEKQKTRKSPIYRSSPPKVKSKKVIQKIKSQKRQGPRHAEADFYNHPRR